MVENSVSPFSMAQKTTVESCHKNLFQAVERLHLRLVIKPTKALYTSIYIQIRSFSSLPITCISQTSAVLQGLGGCITSWKKKPWFFLDISPLYIFAFSLIFSCLFLLLELETNNIISFCFLKLGLFFTWLLPFLPCIHVNFFFSSVLDL